MNQKAYTQTFGGRIKVAKPKRKLTAAQRRARRERKQTTMMVFINGKQKRAPRPQLIEGVLVEEFIRGNADPIWLHQNGLWHLMSDNGDCERPSGV